MDILLALYCILFLTYSSYLCLKIKKNYWNIENFFCIQIVIIYIFVPINLILFGGEIYESDINSYLAPASKFVSLSSFLITLIFILVFSLGGAFRGSCTKLVKIYIRRASGINLSKVTAYSLAFLSLFSLLIYIQQFGGFTSFINNLLLTQSGSLSDEIGGTFAFVGRFIDLAIIPIVYFLYEKSKTRKDFIFILLIPLSVLLFTNLFMVKSKLKFISLGLLFYFTLSLKRKKLYLLYLFLFFAVVFLALPILDEIFILAYRVFNNEGILAVPFKVVSAIASGSLGQGEYESFLKDKPTNLYLKSVDYFVSGQISLQLSIDNSYTLLFFRDFITGISDLLPSRLNIKPGIEVQNLNTAIYYDYYPNIQELTWGVPPGIITFGMYSLSVPGVIIIAFILGYIFREIDLFFKSIVEIDKNFSSFYAYIIFIVGCYSISGMPKMIIYNLIFLVFVLLFFFINFRFETKKEVNKQARELNRSD